MTAGNLRLPGVPVEFMARGPVRVMLPSSGTLATTSATVVTTQAELVSGLTSGTSVLINTSLIITADLTIAAGKVLYFEESGMLIQGASATVTIDACVMAPRRQIFSGFTAGKIRGGFGNDCVFPEWWGMTAGSCQTAINLAAQAGYAGRNAIRILLAQGEYVISGPIDLMGTGASLFGAGGLKTKITAAATWDASSYVDSYLFNASLVADNHSSMIWIGATPGAGGSFGYIIQGLYLDAQLATDNNPTKYISCIAVQEDLEELSAIRDVTLEGYSGWGIGWENVSGVCTINGLIIEQFHIGGSRKRNSYGIAMNSVQTANVVVRNGTINGIVFAASESRTWPLINILAQGTCKIDNVHMEGSCIGIYIPVNDGAGNNVEISNVDGHFMMDLLPVPMVYANDANYTTTNPPSDADQISADPTGASYLKYSCLVYIAWPENPHYGNLKDTVVCSNLTAYEGLHYLIRDPLYNIARYAKSGGSTPNSPDGRIATYSRSHGYGPVTGSEGSWVAGEPYDRDDPAEDRKYFDPPLPLY